MALERPSAGPSVDSSSRSEKPSADMAGRGGNEAYQCAVARQKAPKHRKDKGEKEKETKKIPTIR